MQIMLGNFNIDSEYGLSNVYYEEPLLVGSSTVIVAHNFAYSFNRCSRVINCEYRIICTETSAGSYTCRLIFRPEEREFDSKFNFSTIAPDSIEYSFLLGELKIAREHLNEGIDFLKTAVKQIHYEFLYTYIGGSLADSVGRIALINYWVGEGNR